MKLSTAQQHKIRDLYERFKGIPSGYVLQIRDIEHASEEDAEEVGFWFGAPTVRHTPIGGGSVLMRKECPGEIHITILPDGISN